MKSVMLSIKPKYCELIASGKKTIEVRKTRPKIETPFKCYIYQPKTVYVSKNKENEFLKPIQDKHFGKVIAEFVCDEIQTFRPDDYNCPYDVSDDDLKLTCLNREDMYAYGRGKTLYGWHISDLKIYSEPKALREFWHCGVKLGARVSRPPQSWCYVEIG